MVKQPIPLTPQEIRILAQCPLHYHFWRQEAPRQGHQVDGLVRDTIQQLHAAGGPARLPLEECLRPVISQPKARVMVERYYHRLGQDWSQMMAGNETIQLKISLGGVSLLLEGTVDRLDKTSDGGILAIFFRTDDGPLPNAAYLRRDHALTIYHLLTAATYPLKRPVRLQEWWLAFDQGVTIELSEDEYRRNLSDLREPIQALARGEVRARPGLHCEVCPFKHHGCPVYARQEGQTEPEDTALPQADDKIFPRTWIFKI